MKTLKTLVLGIGLALLIIQFYQPSLVSGISMYPTLSDTDYLIMNKWTYWHNDPEYGDIVAAKYGDKLIVKRVIGKPGDTISFSNGKVYRNGTELDEPYLNEQYTAPGENITLDSDEYYLMGDNRGSSFDSRAEEIGPVNRDNIVGKITVRLFPSYRNFCK